MLVCLTKSELLTNLQKLRDPAATLALVPTMGFLHQGHLSLIELAKRSCQISAVSIFVNPLQFNDKSDLKNYPRALESDLKILESAGVDLVFAPSEAELYPVDFDISIFPGRLGGVFEGTSRPGHFTGVLTVVSILFNLFQPDVSIFGEKDFQQLRLIEKMVHDLAFPIRIIRAVTSRDPGGLALSSRNSRLSSEQLIKARRIYQSMLAAKRLRESGQGDAKVIKNEVKKLLESEAEVVVEYVEIVEETSFASLSELGPQDLARILVAVKIGGVRLIDNFSI